MKIDLCVNELNMEAVFVEISASNFQNSSENIIVGVIYRPPNTVIT